MEVHCIKSHDVGCGRGSFTGVLRRSASDERTLRRLREQEGNIQKTENKIWLDFFNFDQRRFPLSSRILRNVQNHLEL